MPANSVAEIVTYFLRASRWRVHVSVSYVNLIRCCVNVTPAHLLWAKEGSGEIMSGEKRDREWRWNRYVCKLLELPGRIERSEDKEDRWSAGRSPRDTFSVDVEDHLYLPSPPFTSTPPPSIENVFIFVNSCSGRGRWPASR